MNRTGRIATAAVAVYLLASLSHGWAHAAVPVEVPDWQLAFAGVVLFGAPVAGLALVLGGRPTAGLWTLLAVALAGVAFEAMFHFVVGNPDHVATVERGRVLFASTAGVTTLGNAVLALGAGWSLRRQSHGSSSRSRIVSTR